MKTFFKVAIDVGGAILILMMIGGGLDLLAH